MPASSHVTDDTFDAEVLQSSELTIADFWASWCVPCQRLGPVLEEIANQHPGAIKVAKLDVDANPRTPERFGVSGLPTMLVFKGGEVVESIVGFVPKDHLLRKLLPHLN